MNVSSNDSYAPIPRLLVIGAKVALAVIFFVGLFVQAAVIPLAANDVVTAFPETEALRIPAIVVAIALVACGQVVILCTWRLLSLVSRSRIFDPRAFRLVNVMIGASIVPVVLAGGTFALLQLVDALPGAVAIAMIVTTVGAGGLALVLAVMKHLLRLATQLNQEMAEVI